MVELLFRDEINSTVSHTLLIMFTESRPNSAEYTRGSVGVASRILNIDTKWREWSASLSGHFAPEERDSRCLLDGRLLIAGHGLGALGMEFFIGLVLEWKFVWSYLCTNIAVLGNNEKGTHEITTLLTLYVTDPEEVDNVILQNQ